MIKVDLAYGLAGLMFAAVAVYSAADTANPRRWRATAFWSLFAASFLLGDRLGDFANGLLVVGLAVLAGSGAPGRSHPSTTSAEARAESAARLGFRLFWPILSIPGCALVGSVALKRVRFDGILLFDPAQITVICTAIGAVLAAGTAMILFRPPMAAAPQETRRILDAVGWAAILPQLLAALGAVFTLSGVGAEVGRLVVAWLPMDNRLIVVIAYCLGMAAFTMIMGNAFAAFPVLTAGVGAPLIAGRFGGDPAVMGAMGMLAGYCGTLMTPMASHNIVPAALLELPTGAVIRAQAPTALAILAADTALMYWLAFRV